MAVSIVKRVIFSTQTYKPYYSFSSLPSHQNPPTSQTLISTVVSILKHHRSKSRWSSLHSLYPQGFNPSQVSQITLHLRNNPRLALRFFLWTQTHSLCTHNLLSFSTIIHTLARARLKTQAQSLIRSAIRLSESDPSQSNPPKLFQTLVQTYRSCDSAPFVFDLLIRACLQSNRIDQSIAIVRLLQSQTKYPAITTCNSLIRSVVRCHGPDAGYAIYREVFGLDSEIIEERVSSSVRVCPNAQTFNELMLSFYQDDLMERVEEIWIEMAKLNCPPNAYSYCVLMAVYCEENKMGEAWMLWEEMRIKQMKLDVVVYNTMIGGLCKIGEIDRAEELFREMTLSGIESTCVTYEHLINGYCKIGGVDSAILLYKDMRRKDFRPEASVMDEVIRGLCDKNRFLEAFKFLKAAMGSFDFSLSGKSYEFLIKGLCQEGRMEKALKLQGEMVGKGFEPNSEIYGAFIDGYMKQGNKELAGMLRKEMFETQMHQE